MVHVVAHYAYVPRKVFSCPPAADRVPDGELSLADLESVLGVYSGCALLPQETQLRERYKWPCRCEATGADHQHLIPTFCERHQHLAARARQVGPDDGA